VAEVMEESQEDTAADPARRDGGISESASVAGLAEAALRRTRDVVEPVLRTAVETLPGRLRAISAYHLGWEDADGAAIDGNGGKLLRPGLVLAAAAAVGGERVADPAVVAAAAAVELAHNFTLLHDDVIDRDHTRRHRPTQPCLLHHHPAPERTRTTTAGRSFRRTSCIRRSQRLPFAVPAVQRQSHTLRSDTLVAAPRHSIRHA